MSNMIIANNYEVKMELKSTNIFNVGTWRICMLHFANRYPYILVIFLFLFFSKNVSAQANPDSVIVKDSVSPKSETLAKDTSIKPLVQTKRIARVKKDTVVVASPDSTNFNNILPINPAETAAHYPVDSIPLRYHKL